MTLVVKCKSCKAIHESPIQSVTTQKEFVVAKEKSELLRTCGNVQTVEECPRTGVLIICGKNCEKSKMKL